MHKYFSIFLLFSSLALVAQDKETDTALELSSSDSAYLTFLEEYNHIFAYDQKDGKAIKGDIASDAVNIKNRLYSLDQGTPFQLAYNERVLAFIKVYLERKSEQTEWMLGLSRQYFPMMEEILVKYDLPLELKYLSVVESALNPKARSRANAVGLWQFIYSTGRLYGLNINSYEDERMNPVKSTEAACAYLSDLYKMFGDWELALAAYNSGPGNVRKAIRRSGGKQNYWEIYNYLPRETRGYVPAFIAVNYAYNFYDIHGLTPKDTGIYFYQTDTIHFTKNTSLKAVAKWSQVSEDELANLNPSLRGDVIPYKDFDFVMPAASALLFDAIRDSVYNLEQEKTSAPQEPDYITYYVRRGDFLGKIANQYGTTVSTIKRDNGLYSNNLNIGQRLKIVNKNKQQTEPVQKQVEKKIEEVAKVSTNPESTNEKAFKYYTIQPGDTLWDIASKFEGVSVTRLKQLNDVNNVRRLKPGQKIIIGVVG